MTNKAHGRPNNSPITDNSPKEEIKDSLERNKYVFELVNHWIENADNKVSVSCGIFTGVFGVITYLADRYGTAPDNAGINSCLRCIYRGSFVVSLLLMLLAIVLYAAAIIPNLKTSGTPKATQKKYPIFFGDIQSLDYRLYKTRMARGTDEAFNDEIVLESWHNSGVCQKKMVRYRRGVILSCIAIGFALLSLGAHFFMYRV